MVQREELSWSLVVEQDMANHYFDAINYVHQLTEAGVPLAQAEAHANALAGVLIPILTDLAAIKQTVDGLIERTDGLKERIDEMGRRIDRLETRLNWAISIIVATQLALLSMVGGLYLAH